MSQLPLSAPPAMPDAGFGKTAANGLITKSAWAVFVVAVCVLLTGAASNITLACGKQPGPMTGSVMKGNTMTGQPTSGIAVNVAQVEQNTSGAPANANSENRQNASRSKDSTLDSKKQSELVYLVRQDCGSCHGMTLKGGLGVALLPENVKDTPIEALAAIILDGVPDTPMPPWRGLLSETEATWIARQLKKGFPE